MFNFILTQNSTPIIGWCATLLGKVMELIYMIFSGIGIENIGLCIIIFTLIIKLLMFPLTIKQQKFSKLSALMNPEIQAVQKKYQGKTDTDSRMKMNEELQAIYQKYGTSPTGSCLQLLIQMPILFSLYYIVGNVPAYVPQVKSYYEPVSNAIVSEYDYFKYMNKAYDEFIKNDDVDNYKDLDKMIDSFGSITDKKVIDVLAKYSTSQWDELKSTFDKSDELVSEVSKISESDWKKITDDIDDKDKKEKVEEFVALLLDGKTDEFLKHTKEEYDDISYAEKKVLEINEFGPINLSQSPASVMGIALLIPIFCFLSQWISSKLAMAANSTNMQDNPMGNSLKVMNVVLPLFSAFIAYRVPAGLGLYWASNGLFQIIQQLFLNAYFKKVDVNDIVKSNVDKMNRKKERMGIDINKVSNTASTNTKSIKSKAAVSKDIDELGEKKYKPGSMAAKANMVKDFNEKNRK